MWPYECFGFIISADLCMYNFTFADDDQKYYGKMYLTP